ncbi:hypothetical protein OGAPHI_006849 [Ogataea philodendri]|uniref:FAD-binding domain-containing protein n=1 Tax=Ogataea philodendri TaxID=1378263 RepID=A0A9P8NXM3_9ASCO|nr:uncharacterized protein OGAPHI_006849 [Ogataea philodendri]KAH3661442.1 hypothetical protein OGAPHI_006849 [Ogataea philodendri]
MTADSETRPLRIAILGAGLVGAFAAVALSKLPNVEITVYEKSQGIREVGAAITLTEGGLVTLSKVFDLEELEPILYRSPKHGHITRRHWKTGEYFKEPEPTHPDELKYSHAKAQRILLLEFILKHVPEGLIKYDHEVKGVDVKPDGATINFKDRTPVRADLVISADGIYSKIRRQFTNDKIIYKGAVAYRNVFDDSIVNDIPGVPDDVTVWIGKGSAMFMTRLTPGKFNVAAHLRDPPDVASKLKWDRGTGDWGKQRLIEHFKDWDPVIGKILDVMPESIAFPLERAPWLRNLVVGNRIVFVGDAAHPTSGVYGAGANMGWDDVWALYKSLTETSDRDYDLPSALFLFNETRVPFLKRVEEQIDIDQAIGAKYLATASDDDEWRKRIEKRGLSAKWITAHNVNLEFEKVRDKHFLDVFA